MINDSFDPFDKPFDVTQDFAQGRLSSGRVLIIDAEGFNFKLFDGKCGVGFINRRFHGFTIFAIL